MPYLYDEQVLYPNNALNVGANTSTGVITRATQSGTPGTRIALMCKVNTIVTGPITFGMVYSFDGVTYFPPDASQPQVSNPISAVGTIFLVFNLLWNKAAVNVNLAAGSGSVSVSCMTLP